jgi:phosphate transport system protein
MEKTRLLDKGLVDLSNMLHNMAQLAERTVAASIQAYLEGGEVTLQVRQWSDTLLNDYDQVSEKALELIARYQPVATDLRMIRACMEISYDLSRFGRYALDIVTIFQALGGRREFGQETVSEMGQRTMKMIEASIEAFRTRNTELAEKVREEDEEVDELYRKHLQDCVRNPPKKIEQLISDVLTVRHLERIADHAVDLARTTLYMIDGRQVSPWK